MVERLVKVIFELDSRDWHGHGSELLWAAPVSTEPGSTGFQLKNSPFFATGIGRHDVVKAEPTENSIVYRFEDVVARSGHSTYMLLVEGKPSKFHSYWRRLEAEGCSYESMHIKLSIGERLLLSVDVPPSADLPGAYDIFKQAEADGVWVFQEGYAHLPIQRA